MPISEDTARWVDERFASSIVPTLVRYIEIPNKSPAFDPEWRQAGHMARAVELLAEWARSVLPEGAELEVVQLGERTPLIVIEVPATGGANDDTVLLYGHLDKQPEMTGWRAGLGPFTPVLDGDKLYGRGGADDGYALFASLTALLALRRDGAPHARAVVLIEACEESGSYDLPAYIEHLASRIGQPSLVVCLDSGCANYDQLWSTTSLRGVLVGTLEVSLLSEGVHSGDASGIVASSFRVARQLLSRLENEGTGAIELSELTVPIPEGRIAQARQAAATLGNEVWSKFPLQPGVTPVATDNAELILNRTWRPALAVTGAEGLPALANAGNVMRPVTRLKLSLRLPPRLGAERAAATVKAVLESDPPYGAKIRFDSGGGSNGWDAPELAPWLASALQDASQRRFGKPAMYLGEGGSIPFMAMLGEKFPAAQFLITGVLGPDRTRTVRTNFCTCPPPVNSPCAWPTCSQLTPLAEPRGSPHETRQDPLAPCSTRAGSLVRSRAGNSLRRSEAAALATLRLRLRSGPARLTGVLQTSRQRKRACRRLSIAQLWTRASSRGASACSLHSARC